MSVLIKGMEMPPDCRVCPFEMYYINTGKTRCGAAMRTLAENFKTIPFVGRAEFCPLIELQPHGRLIDADALVKKQPIPELGTPRWLIEQAPTIIPAEPTQINAPNTLDALTNACPLCKGTLSGLRRSGGHFIRHCYSCNFDFPIDKDGNAIRLKGETT